MRVYWTLLKRVIEENLIIRQIFHLCGFTLERKKNVSNVSRDPFL